MSDKWEEAFDEASQKVYYYNSQTNETSWEKPVYSPNFGESEEKGDEVLDNSSEDHMDNWTWSLDENSNTYYYINLKTNVTQWERPKCFGDENKDGDESSVGIENNINDNNSEDDDRNNWTSILDENSNTYYYVNLKTNASQWEMPPCFNSKGENIENVNVSDVTNSDNIIATNINTKEENEMNQIENDLKQIELLSEILPFSSATLMNLYRATKVTDDSKLLVENLKSLSTPLQVQSNKINNIFENIIPSSLITKIDELAVHSGDNLTLLQLISNNININNIDDNIILGLIPKICDYKSKFSMPQFYKQFYKSNNIERWVESKLSWSPSLLSEPIMRLKSEKEVKIALLLNQHILCYTGDCDSSTMALTHAVEILELMLNYLNLDQPHHNDYDINNITDFTKDEISVDDYEDCDNLDSNDPLFSHAVSTLTDELYCQLYKQLRKNPSSISLIKSWQLLCICLVSIPPSSILLPHLLCFCALSMKTDYLKKSYPVNDVRYESISSNNSLFNDKLNNLIYLSTRCCIILMLTQNSLRTIKPSKEEIYNTINGSIHHKVKLSLLNYDEYLFDIDYWCTIDMLKIMICDKLGIQELNRSFFHIFEMTKVESSNKTSPGMLQLSGSIRVLDILAKIENKMETSYGISSYLVFKICNRFILRDLDKFMIDSAEYALIYHETVNDIIYGYYPMSKQDCMFLTALKLNEIVAHEGRSISDPSGFKVNENFISEILPKQIYQLGHNEREMAISQIKIMFSKFSQKLCIQETRQIYINYMKTVKFFGCYFFNAETLFPGATSPSKVILAVNSNFIMILSPASMTIFLELTMNKSQAVGRQHIKSWIACHHTLTLKLKNKSNSNVKMYEELHFVTEDAVKIADLLSSCYK